jgi:hypothetical protein
MSIINIANQNLNQIIVPVNDVKSVSVWDETDGKEIENIIPITNFLVENVLVGRQIQFSLPWGDPLKSYTGLVSKIIRGSKNQYIPIPENQYRGEPVERLMVKMSVDDFLG